MDNKKKVPKRIAIEIYLIIHSLIIITYYVALPQLVLKKVCHQRFNSTVCQRLHESDFKSQQDKCHKESSTLLLIMELIGAIPSIPVQLLLGAISDSVGSIGKKRMLLISPILLAVQSVVLFLNAYYFSINVYFLLAAPLVTVFIGQSGGAILLVYVYAADMTPRGSQRTLKLSVIVSCYTIANAAAGVTSGLLIHNFGFATAYFVTFALSILNCVYTIFFVPTSAPSSSGDHNTPHINNSEQKARPSSIVTVVLVPAETLTENVTKVEQEPGIQVPLLGKTPIIEASEALNCEEITRKLVATAQSPEEEKGHNEYDLAPGELEEHVKNSPTLESCAERQREDNDTNYYEIIKGKDTLGECSGENSKPNNNIKDSVAKKNCNLYSHIKTAMLILFESKHRINRLLILLAFGLTCIAYAGEFSIRILYIKYRPFNMNPEEVGYYFGAMKLTKGFGVVLVTKILAERFKFSDFALTAVGLINEIAVDISTAIASTKLMLYLSIASGITVSLPECCLRAAISKTVAKDRHGSILSAMAAVQTVFIIIACMLSQNIYRMTVSWFPGFQFLVSAGFCLIALLLVIILYRADRTKDQKEKAANNAS